MPTNPYLRCVDVERLADICKKTRAKTLVDATFATPVNAMFSAVGIDLVVHSATKYLGGHNDVLGGVIAGDRALVSLVRDLRHVLGGVLDPHAAYLVHRGLKTLAVRVAHQNASALKIAQALELHPRVRRVYYPGLPSHPDAAVAARLMDGYGGVVTFDVEGDLASVSRFVDACRIPRIAPSLGGVESLIEQPAVMSYWELGEEGRKTVGIGETLVRLSVGLEDPDELVADLLGALDRSI
jgi:cystathionine gamma-synthase